ncbi:BTB/POZ domain-containing protein 6-like [Ruditapes philippinarum]|uniref:BTB/POZ domain-containing protein 6-like n=1 Tax=Ruditapes philippinarum TaxID=129788 RepID=UPI00295A9978|nr:BTB/POZ domain-containing protein 6-like [Ruditapes philippinarum]
MGDDWQTGKSLIEANVHMLHNEIATDVIFLVGDDSQEVRAHKYVTMSRSPVLLRALKDHMDNTDIAVSVPDVAFETFKYVLTYLYTENIDIHADNVTSLLYAARRLQLSGLSKLCFSYLETGMSVANVCKILEQAHIYNETNLHDKCLTYILSNATDVLKTHAFNDLCSECVGAIIRSDDIKADEDSIFEAMVLWSTNECRRQKKPSTDIYRREVMGPLLYLIRFPTMDVSYFTHRVSFRDILSHDEAVSIYQYFHGEERQLSKLFNKNERNRLKTKRPFASKKEKNQQRQRDPNEVPLIYEDTPKKRPQVKPQIPISYSSSPNMSRVSRFRTYDGQWKQNGPPDAISFTCSSPIVLYGIEVFGAAKGCETYNMKLFLFDDLKDEVRKNDARITTDALRRTFDAMYARPIRVPPRRIFTIMVIMKGSPTSKGVDGSSVHIADGVTFEFINSNRSSNGTDVSVGQIAALLFNKTE